MTDSSNLVPHCHRAWPTCRVHSSGTDTTKHSSAWILKLSMLRNEWESAGKAKAPLLSPCKGEIEAHFGGKPCYCCCVPGGWLCKSGLFTRSHSTEQSVMRSSLCTTMSNGFTCSRVTGIVLPYIHWTDATIWEWDMTFIILSVPNSDEQGSKVKDLKKKSVQSQIFISG